MEVALERRRVAWPAIRRGGRLVLQEHDAIVPAAAVVGLVGVNGAGKSTLMLHLAGMLCARQRTQDAVSYAPQRATLPDWLTVPDFARMFSLDIRDIHRRFPSMRMDELCDARAGTLSAGQMQAVAVSLALAGDAPLVLLDEPFAPLDFRRRVALTRILTGMRDNLPQRTVIVSMQSAAEVYAVCSWVLVLRGGRCVYNGPVAALTGPGQAGERAVVRLEERLLDLLDDVDDVSALRRPIACHPP